MPDAHQESGRRREWERAASVLGGARELLAVPDGQVSLGQAPSPERALERHLWHAAMNEVTTAPDAAGRDWRTVDDTGLYQAREQWARDLEHAPDWVGDELAAAHQLIRDYNGDAVRDAARARREHHHDPDLAADYARRAEIAAGAADLARERAAELETAHQARQAWWAEHGGREQDARAAGTELARRGLPVERGVVEPPPEVIPDRDLDPAAQVDPIGTELTTPERPDRPEAPEVVEPSTDDEHRADRWVVEPVRAQPEVNEPEPESVQDWARRLDEREATAAAATAARRAEQREADRARLEAEAEAQQRAELEAQQAERGDRQREQDLALGPVLDSPLDPEPALDEDQLDAEHDRRPGAEPEASEMEHDAPGRVDTREVLQKARDAARGVRGRAEQLHDQEQERHRARNQHHRQHRQRERDHGREHGY